MATLPILLYQNDSKLIEGALSYLFGEYKCH